jgi:hypothetical protein
MKGLGKMSKVITGRKRILSSASMLAIGVKLICVERLVPKFFFHKRTEVRASPVPGVMLSKRTKGASRDEVWFISLRAKP